MANLPLYEIFTGLVQVYCAGAGPGSMGNSIASDDNRMRAPAALLLASAAVALLSGCSSGPDNMATIFADPGKYEYHNCEQIAAQVGSYTKREQELRALMNKASEDAGGGFVNAIAYKQDHVAATEELRVLAATARRKNCNSPADWRSNTVIR
jgi:hypothetical protein